MVRLVPLALVLACIAGGAADTPPLPANASLSAALGIFADPDRIPPETLVPGFVCTVFVPNDVGAKPCLRCPLLGNLRPACGRRSFTCAAIAAFLRAAQLTPRQLRDNKTLLDALAREHVVPHVRGCVQRSVCGLLKAES